MDHFKEKFRYYNSLADKELAKYPQVNKLEQTTGVPKTYLAAGVLSIVSILIFFNFWGELLSNLIGWLYPAYASFKAVESAEKTDDTQWLTYWLFLPGFKGAQVLYSKFFRPVLLSYEDGIDHGINKTKKVAKSVVNAETDPPLNSNKSD
ncbi:21068_t:CDS:2 [Entrophospora sp. SA101]|nr:13856_t:CDS:2 [Entrophospora sp. SA101]CAJ0747580.1 21068_t:CDS:2 [Entrophospora sp. SA101]CAJ0915818.1 19770_t:CDS:2 [Entrophospora sp. SA101]